MGKKKGRTACVDFNGVLDTYTGWKGPDHLYPPREGVREFLEQLSAMYTVVVLTTFDHRKVRGWLRAHGLDGLVSDVTNKKIPATVYIDDRAVRFDGDYGATLREVERFRTHWERAKDGDG
jgi:hypothetical protein